MAFCSKCGAKLEDGSKFCESCGEPVKMSAEEKVSAAAAYFTEKVSKINDTEDTTSEFDQKDISDNKAFAILAYISWLVLIPIFAAKDSKFARFHANQGFVLCLIETGWWLVSAIVGGILGFILWRAFVLVWLINLIFSLVNILFLVLMILGIVNAAQGKAKELPIIGKIKILK